LKNLKPILKLLEKIRIAQQKYHKKTMLSLKTALNM
jgi:hypothetical protein